MKKLTLGLLVVIFWGTFFHPGLLTASDASAPEAVRPETSSTDISFADDVGDAMKREMERVGDHFQQQAMSLFKRTPLDWDTSTLDFLYQWCLTLPLRVPEFIQVILDQGRILGVVGSLLVLTFLIAVCYSLFGQKRVMAKVEALVQPFRPHLPETTYPYLLSLLKIGVASLIPLLLLGVFSVINAFIAYQAKWFLLTGRLLGVWVISALATYVLRESLTAGLYAAAEQYGRTIYKRARLVVFYIAGGMAIYWGAEAAGFPHDVLAFLKFAITLSVVCVLLLLFYNKTALMSLLPELPYAYYQKFKKSFARFYLPVIYATFLTGVMWCFGYYRLCRAIWTKTWAVAGVFVGFFVVYHLLQGKLNQWASSQTAERNEDAEAFFKSLKALWLYISATASILIILDLLGAREAIARAMSFTVLTVGGTHLSLWVFLKAILVFIAFVFGSSLLRSYLGYKIYPSIGVDTGLAYALNIFLRYFILVVAVVFSLRVVGLSLKVLMVFAGAAGIGIGLGLQNMTANIVSGLSLIFGQKIRKGDWLQVGDTLGIVTDIYLRATKLKSRDDIEYLIPNLEFLTNTVVNYTLSSPNIRLAIPLGVSYNAEPQRVAEILITAAQAHPELSTIRKPEIRFVGYGDNSIDFEVLVWINIQTTARRMARSLFYFTAFEALNKEGIEIPYPQRDIHIRSGFTQVKAQE